MTLTMLVSAAAQAQKASDLILGVVFEKKDDDDDNKAPTVIDVD